MHMFMPLFSVHTHKHPQFSAWQSSKVYLYFCMSFSFTVVVLLCISNRYILVFSSWNETYSPKEIKRREMGKVSERNMKNWLPEASIQIFFPFLFLRKSEWSSAGHQILLAWKGWLFGRDVHQDYIIRVIFRERDWLRVSGTFFLLLPPILSQTAIFGHT